MLDSTLTTLRTLALGVITALAVAPLGAAAASRTPTTRSASQKPVATDRSNALKQPAPVSDHSLAETLRQPIEMEIPSCSPSEVLEAICGGPDAGFDGSPPTGVADAPEDPSEPVDDAPAELPFAYDLFEPDYDGSSNLQAYLLAVAAFNVYEPAYWGEDDVELAASVEPDPALQELIAAGGDSTKLEDYLEEHLERYGIEDVDVYSDVLSGAQAMMITTPDVAILAFRGTQSPISGVDGVLDWLTNFKILAHPVLGWGMVHLGDLTALHTIREQVTNAARSETELGRKLWVTGHSMGGALATLAVMHFVDEDIPVEGVHVFGNPRASDFVFAASYADRGLEDRTWRWQVSGDPIGNLPHVGHFCVPYLIGCVWTKIPFDHVGGVNHIFPDKDDSGDITGYELAEDQLDLDLPVWPHYLIDGFRLEHAKYDDALLQFLSEELEGDLGEELAQEWGLEDGADLIDVLPPVQLDPLDR